MGVLLLDFGGNIWGYLLYGLVIGVYCYGIQENFGGRDLYLYF